MIIDPEIYGEQVEESYVERGGGGGGKKKKVFGGEHRGEKINTEVVNAVKESERQGDALKRVSEKLESILEKDKSMDAREIKAYFEWLRIALICSEEICRMKKDSSKDQELALEMMMKGKDLEEDFVRSQGAGGQNVNKVSSAVQLRHIPSGYFVKVQESRDQYQNRPIARQRLQEQLCKHLNDWETVIGDKKDKEVMAEVFGSTLERQGEIKGVRGEVLKKVVADLKEGRNL